MDKYTKKIINFILKNNILSNETYNIESNELIKLIIEKINNVINNKKQVPEYEIKKIKNNKELNDIFYDNNFVSSDILKELEINNINNIIIEEDNYYLSLYYYNIDNIDKYILKIINVINIIKELNEQYDKKNDKKNDNYNVILFLGNQKKYIYSDKIMPISMNSGSSIIEEYASLWRKEEFEKVLIHELLHFISADFHKNIKGYDNLDKNINNIFKIDGINSPNESYNETLAGIINMCYKSVIYKMNINVIYKIEMNFLYFQTAKLINFFGGNKMEDLFNKLTIKQTTSALSYIILKMILFHNITDTLNFIKSINFKCNNTEKINLFNDFN